MSHTVKQISPRAIVAGTFSIFFLPYLIVLLFPAQLDRVIEKSSYLVFHNVAVFLSVTVSLCVFSVGWFTYEQSKDQRALFMGTAFLAVGLLDFMHALGNPAMPAFVTPNSDNKSTQFWVCARLLEAVTFLFSAFINPERKRCWISKTTMLAGAAVLTVSVFTAVIFFPGYLPVTALHGGVLTPLKIYLELTVIGLLACSGVVYWNRLEKTGDRHLLYFLAAFIVLIASGAAFASYKQNFSTFNVLGHLYKAVAFSLMYLGIFVSAVRKPYLQLSEANEKLLRLNRLYTVRSETNKAIVRAPDRERLFQEICRVTVQYGGFMMAWVGMVNEETGRVEPVAWAGENDGYLDAIAISARPEAGWAELTGAAIREGRLQICRDVNEPCAGPWRAEAKKRGYRSSAAIALNLNHEPIGALTIYAGECNFFDSQLAELLSQMASDISFALESIEGEARHRQVERALKEETLERLRAMESLHERDQLLIQQSRLAAMGEMINNIAHQWRQPLNVVGLIVQELQLKYSENGLSKEFFDTKVENLMKVLQHMSQTIEDFRRFFRPDKKKESFLVNDLLARTLSLVEGSFKAREISFEMNIDSDLEIHGYPNEYSQVLLNILLNARDAFSEGAGAGPRVVGISACNENGTSVVTITDNAGGIPQEIIHKVFDPYFTTKGPDKGTGLGLYMSKTIIDKNMNGRLTVCNIADGAEFRIEIPSAETEGSDCRACSPAAAAAA